MKGFVFAGSLGFALLANAEHARQCDAPVGSMNETTFVECARAGTERYRDRTVAIVDGYRPIGRDFPSMGEHWIRISLLFDGRFEPSRPEVLNYVVVNGTPELAGVGYAVPLLPGETVPDGPAGPHAWHDHSRTIHEETVLPHHHRSGQDGGGARLAMLHAWVWTANPDGMFAADNWAIPLRRSGLTAPSSVPRAAAKAVALATGGRDYFERAVDAAGAAERRVAKNAMDDAQRKAQYVVASVGRADISDADLARLALIWNDMWQRIDAAASPEIRQRLSELPIR